MMIRTRLAAIAIAGAAAMPAQAQAPRSPAPRAAPAAPAVPATPQQTTASFADWTLRCTRTAADTRLCEVVQTIQRDERTVAQIALGRVAKGQPLQLTVLVPPNVGLGAGPSLRPGPEGDTAPAADLVWRRCLPGGCIADATLSDDLTHRLRAWTEPGRIVFSDGAGRPAVLPFSPRGLAQALDAMAKEDSAS